LRKNEAEKRKIFKFNGEKKIFALCIGNILTISRRAREAFYAAHMYIHFFRLKINIFIIFPWIFFFSKMYRAIDDRLIEWSSKIKFEFPNYKACNEIQKQWNFFVMTKLLIIFYIVLYCLLSCIVLSRPIETNCRLQSYGSKVDNRWVDALLKIINDDLCIVHCFELKR
jgi:hypothetical protein